jgi:hypothetical protein
MSNTAWDGAIRICEILKSPSGEYDEERVKVLLKIAEILDAGNGVFDGVSYKHLAFPRSNGPTTQRSTTPVMPITAPWTCGCSADLRGDELVCWRCGAPKP